MGKPYPLPRAHILLLARCLNIVFHLIEGGHHRVNSTLDNSKMHAFIQKRIDMFHATRRCCG